MFDSQHKECRDAELFRQAVACLTAKSISFWLADGALLGLIRDGALIPWDEDIDFGVWDSNVTEGMILDAFDTGQFRIDSLWKRDIPAVHIFPLSPDFKRHLEITFYTKQRDRAVHQTYFTREDSTLWMRVIAFVLECVQGKDSYYFASQDSWLFTIGKRIMYGILSFLVSTLLPERIIEKLRTSLKQYLESWHRVPFVYEFPAHFFEELQTGEFFGVDVKFPKDVEGYLETAYGKDWRTPKQWGNWWEGATTIGTPRRL